MTNVFDFRRDSHFNNVMPRYCAVYGCSNNSSTSSNNISYHTFPTDNEIRQQWIVATKRKNFSPGKFSFLCSDHFISSDFVEFSSVKKLYPNAIPSLLSGLPNYFHLTAKRRSTVSIQKRRWAGCTTVC